VTFPVLLHAGPLTLHPHPVFEALGYATGYAVYRLLRRNAHDPIPDTTRWILLTAAAVGAAVGSRIVYWLDAPALTWAHRGDAYFLIGGKSIVGGLLGGWVAVEWAKRTVGESRATGDLYVVPLAVGLAVGRIGCFLTGLDDHTYGVATALPWGVDFGDGVRRHPTQLYESAFALVLALVAWVASRRRPALPAGALFLGFVIAYLVFRVLLETIKPGPCFYLNLDGIQGISLLGAAYAAWRLARLARAARGLP
jgi:phosphatidylglycerol:prolipoprotein diacylglycerol transferase